MLLMYTRVKQICLFKLYKTIQLFQANGQKLKIINENKNYKIRAIIVIIII